MEGFMPPPLILHIVWNLALGIRARDTGPSHLDTMALKKR